MNIILDDAEVNAPETGFEAESYEPTTEESAWWASECDDRDDRELAEWLMELEQRAEESAALSRMEMGFYGGGIGAFGHDSAY